MLKKHTHILAVLNRHLGEKFVLSAVLDAPSISWLGSSDDETVPGRCSGVRSSKAEGIIHRHVRRNSSDTEGNSGRGLSAHVRSMRASSSIMIIIFFYIYFFYM